MIDPTTPTPSTDRESPAPPPSGAWRRLARMGAPRLTRANLVGALLALLLGFGFATQVQQTQAGGLDQLREDELVQLLDDVSARSARLDQEIRQLEADRDTLQSGVGSSASAIEQAQERLDTLGILAGTVPAVGPGVRMSIEDPEGRVTGTVLLDIVQELRDAGAEVIQIGTVRVVASTSFSDVEGRVFADAVELTRPYSVAAIGEPSTIASAMNIPGGASETIRGLGGELTISETTNLRIDALHTPRAPRYAQPVPDPSPTSTPTR